MLIKMMNRLKKEEKGFTLIELLAVIVILAVIAAIAVPYILGVINKSKADADAALFNQVYEAARLYVTSEKGGTPDGPVNVLADLINRGYLTNGIVMPSTKNAITGGQLTYDTTAGTTFGQLTGINITTGSGASLVTYTATAANVIAGKGPVSTVVAAPTPTPAGQGQ